MSTGTAHPARPRRHGKRSGAPYYKAVALADSSEDHDLDHALSLFLELGARPMARLVAEVSEGRECVGFAAVPVPRPVTTSPA